MAPNCCVKTLYEWLRGKIDSGELADPRGRQKATEIFDLVHDIVHGRAGNPHMDSIEALARALVEEKSDPACRAAGNYVMDFIGKHREVFDDHIRTQNCAAGQCPMLTPAPCQMACPAGIDIPTYVTLIGQGRYAEAIDVIRKDNPFPWVCGLICTHPCEFMCVRGRVDAPIAIMDLKGFAAEKALSAGRYRNPPKLPENGRKVCIIGAGPGGLTAAYYLALKGYRVTVLEALPVAGGMMMVGIPRYRLPREVIDREVSMIEALGVEIRLNALFGRDIPLDALEREGYDAYLLAVGAHGSYRLGIAGENDFPQVIPAVDFLRRVSLGDHRMPGKRVAVIGGGNVAIDAARTALRLGADDVTIVYRRTRDEMPAHVEEIVEAEEEGIGFAFLTLPEAIHGKNGRVTAMVCKRARLSDPDGSGRQRPVPVEGSSFEIEVDAVIPAIGQDVNRENLSEFAAVEWSRRQTINVDTISMHTGQENVFAVGDAVTGPATVVEAIAGGKKAAMAIHRSLEGIAQPKLPPAPVRRGRMECFEVPAALKMDLTRAEMPLLNNERRRITFQQVRLGLDERSVADEARRCLRCDICIRCGRCVDICRNKMGIGALQLGYLRFDKPGPTDLKITAEKCIACGACAANCPTGALRIIEEDGERKLCLAGTVLNRLPLETCGVCGSVLGPARYHDFVMRRIGELRTADHSQHICRECARKRFGETHARMHPPGATGDGR